MEKKINRTLTVDDLAWVSAKLLSVFKGIKHSQFLTQNEKNSEIQILVSRALRFGLDELVEKFGYMIIDIPLSNNREARLIIPHDCDKRDFEIIIHRIEMLRGECIDATMQEESA